MEESRIAVVTGASRGIGREIARQLAARGMTVVLTARDRAGGESAAAALREAGGRVEFHPLDVTDPGAARGLADGLRRRHGRVDVLVNNAGVALERWATRISGLDPDVLRRTLETNLLGVLHVCQALLPLMGRGGRIVNLSSGLGQLQDMQSGSPAYRISKTALNALTRIISAETEGAGIKVNAMCPGWVRTDMGGTDAPKSVVEGADTAIWLATLPDDGPTGGFFRERAAIPW